MQILFVRTLESTIPLGIRFPSFQLVELCRYVSEWLSELSGLFPSVYWDAQILTIAERSRRCTHLDWPPTQITQKKVLELSNGSMNTQQKTFYLRNDPMSTHVLQLLMRTTIFLLSFVTQLLQNNCVLGHFQLSDYANTQLICSSVAFEYCK